MIEFDEAFEPRAKEHHHDRHELASVLYRGSFFCIATCA